MDWGALAKSVGPIILQNAPTIGGVLGGLIPIPGGSLIGQEAGNILANVFGTPPGDAGALATAIQNDPNGAAAKLQAAETEAAAKWPALAQMAQAMFQANAQEADAINATMRAELATGQKWWAWRNLYGYSVGIEATATSWVILYSLVLNPMVFKNVSDSLPFFLSWYGMRFGLLGYIHNQSTTEKVAAVTGQAPDGIIKSITKAVKGK